MIVVIKIVPHVDCTYYIIIFLLVTSYRPLVKGYKPLWSNLQLLCLNI